MLKPADGRTSRGTVLGVDVGTSAVKCAAVADGAILAVGSAPLSVSSPQPGWSEQDPGDWIAAARDAMAQAMQAGGVPADAVAGIGLSGQMHGAVTLDRAGAPIRPAILWNDNRAAEACAALSRALPDIGDIAGILPLPGFTAPKLMWMRAHEPRRFAAIAKILLPKDYLAHWLTGEAATDTSDAAGTMWLDQRRRCWSAASIAASGIDAAWLPPLRHGFDLTGRLRPAAAADLGLARGLPVFAGAGDAAAGALSLGAAEAGKCFVSLGTSGQLLVVDDRYAPAPEAYVHAYCHTLPGAWFRMAAMLNGARPLAWFAQVLGQGVADMLARADACDPARIPVFLPYLTGERSPHGDPDIRGGFYGLDDATGPAEMARAVVEAVAFSIADARDSFGRGFAPDGPIPAIGGGARADSVLQTLADALDHPVARTGAGAGGAALGAALLAEAGLGLRDPAALAFAPRLTRTFTPRPDPALRARHERYRTLYRALKTRF